MGTDAWSLGSRDGDRWLWRRDDATRVVTAYDAHGNWASSRPYTVEENRRADRRASQEALRARLKDARGTLGIQGNMSLPERLARVEAILSALVEDYTDGQ